MMRQKIIAGNWKMVGTPSSVEQLLTGLLTDADTISAQISRIVFPPYVFLAQTQRRLTGSPIAWGAQNLNDKAIEQGAYTGEISAKMLADGFDCRYVLVGHSERRLYYGETNTMIAEKCLLAKRAGLIPILCVGETAEERENHLTESVVITQLETVLNRFEQETDVEFMGTCIAYEPVWAIGTGKIATPEQAQHVHGLLRNTLPVYNADLARVTRIIYGGSLKPDNAAVIFNMPDIDGGLVGGASLDAQQFLQICRAAEQ